VVANFENDSITVLDLNSRSVVAELDLRPGNGVAGGEFPLWVAIRGNDKAYVSSTRDREVVVIDLSTMQVSNRIAVGGSRIE
jgi:YVTN family beta-propeller protein